MMNLTLEKTIREKPTKTDASLIVESVREEVLRRITPEEAIHENINLFCSNPHLVEMAYNAVEDGNFEKLANSGLNLDYLDESINQFYNRNVNYEKAFVAAEPNSARPLTQTLFSIASHYVKELYDIFQAKAKHLG